MYILVYITIFSMMHFSVIVEKNKLIWVDKVARSGCGNSHTITGDTFSIIVSFQRYKKKHNTIAYISILFPQKILLNLSKKSFVEHGS